MKAEQIHRSEFIKKVCSGDGAISLEHAVSIHDAAWYSTTTLGTYLHTAGNMVWAYRLAKT